VDVRILGCSGTYPSPTCPCSGFLITGTESRVWIDAGTGTFQALQRVVDYTSVDALVLTHLHSDHCLDLFPYYYALRLHPELPRGIPVYAPPGSLERLVKLIYGDNTAIFSEVFDFRPLAPGDRVEVGDLRLEFALTQHPIPTFAAAVTSDSHRLVYSADTGPGGDLHDLARDADSFICEASWQNGHHGPPLHLTAAEAGAVGNRAGVGKLFLTHPFPTLDHRRSAEEAAETFGDEPVVLEPGMVLRTVGSRIETV